MRFDSLEVIGFLRFCGSLSFIGFLTASDSFLYKTPPFAVALLPVTGHKFRKKRRFISNKKTCARDNSIIHENRLDVSTRGFGSTKEEKVGDRKGAVVQDDFQLAAIDLVSGHSNPEAEVQFFQEHR